MSYTSGTTAFRQENEIEVEQLHRFGIAATSEPFNTGNLSPMDRALLPGIIGTTATITSFLNFRSNAIPIAENRWVGDNRGAYSNPELDRLSNAFDVALEPAEQVRLTAALEQPVRTEL